MSWFSSWFKSGPAAAEKVLDAGIRGIDALVYTDEEKAVARQKLSETWLDLQKVMVQETSVQAVTRRILAVLIMVPFVGLVLASAVMYGVNPEYGKFLLELANSQFGWLVLGVAGFYFGPYMIGRSMGSKKEGA